MSVRVSGRDGSRQAGWHRRSLSCPSVRGRLGRAFFFAPGPRVRFPIGVPIHIYKGKDRINMDVPYKIDLREDQMRDYVPSDQELAASLAGLPKL